MAAHGRVFNFSAGPAMLPLEVLEQTQRDTLNFNGSGMSVMEMSHRSKAFEGVIKQAEADLRTLLSIPDNYKVLFVQGGASTQFAAIPLNFTQEGEPQLPACRKAFGCHGFCEIRCRCFALGFGVICQLTCSFGWLIAAQAKQSQVLKQHQQQRRMELVTATRLKFQLSCMSSP
jgi:hypothetical protein